MDEKDKELLISFIILSASILIMFCIFFFYKTEESLYFNILKLISLLEIAFLYSKFLSMDEAKNFINDSIMNRDNYKYLTFPIELNFDYFYSNTYLYNATKSVYIFLNIILCIETIKLIKKPFSHSKKRINVYYVISVLLLTISIIVQRFIQNEIYSYINDALYFIFVLSGIISIIFVVIRFCLNKPLIQSAKNFFAVRHIIYIIFLSGIFLNELSFFYEKKFVKNIIVFSLGIITSFIKISEKLFFCGDKNSKKSKKKGASSVVSSNLNVEFIWCILYGLTEILEKNKYKVDNNENAEKEKTHSIKYLNAVVGKINNIKSLVIDVSSEKSEGLLDENGGAGSSNNGEDASITEYFPQKFDELRKNDGISDDIMLKSFSPKKNKTGIEKMMGESKGKSGSFFFYSHDRKFIIKTITNEEKETMDEILLDYYNYIKEHKSTLITKIYGIFTVVIKNASSVNVILMQNLFGCTQAHIQRMFDLKGSTVQRNTKNVQNWKKYQVLKDMDYQWLTQIERNLINFNQSDIKEIKTNMENDILFYKRLSLMDYSLLFIIVDYPNNIDPDYNQILGLLEDPKYKGHVYKSDNKNYIYIIGIIDYLQKYNCKKKLENFLKGIYFGKEKNMISAVPPGFYGDRFQDFMSNKVFVFEPDY